ncbi:hypothetical protein [Acidicapsa acidisoli]|uniref:hypothetical protein n=1 Tax=Acidicapsa acidisoli TaxID=1615681 RepID=UPI0021E00CD5|nr:hypothetical protein [Acidicapsa acidisoli]
MNGTGARLCILFIGAFALIASGCRSYWIDANIENQTGQPIHELEVDYPSASFGTNTLASGAAMHYRFQTRGSGPVKVEYTSGDGRTTHAQGTTLAEHQEGQLTIRLLPLGKVEFVPKLQPAS